MFKKRWEVIIGSKRRDTLSNFKMLIFSCILFGFLFIHVFNNSSCQLIYIQLGALLFEDNNDAFLRESKLNIVVLINLFFKSLDLTLVGRLLMLVEGFLAGKFFSYII